MTPPRRILMTVDAVGGVWSYAVELCRALSPLRFEVVLAHLGPPPSARQREQVAAIAGVTFIETGLELDWLATDGSAVDAAAATIAALAEAQSVEIVHLNQPALATAARFAMPIVVVVHSCVAGWWQAVHGGEPPLAFAWQTERVARGLRCAAEVVAPTRAFAVDVQRLYGLPRMPEVVANGRTSFYLAPSPPGRFAFTAGRLWDSGKNVATLDRVAARLRVPLRAAGPLHGPNGDGVALRHVDTLGSLEDRALAAQLEQRPIFVSAARYEPFGLAVLEAGLAGCPLVLSDIPTFREIWGDAACFVAPSDEDGYVEAIEALLDDDGERLRRGAAARACAARYTPARLAAAMTAIYTRALAAHSPAARSAA